jgi:N-acetylmuramoyl-L-alanine amidase
MSLLKGAAPRTRAWRLSLGVGALFALLAFAPLPQRFDARVASPPELADEEYQRLARFAGTRTRAEIDAALAIVDPEGGLAGHYQLDDHRFTVSSGVGNTRVSIALRPQAAPERQWPRQRIALDPGHFGGAWSEREDRHIVAGGGRPVREGELTWATARLIADDLGRAGKTVILTRTAPPTTPYPADLDPAFSPTREAAYRLAEQRPTVFPWLTPLTAGRLAWAHRQLVNDTTFELYQRHDLRRRAAVATNFAADVTLSLHFNTTENDSNGIVVFVPGNFLAGDFGIPAQRYWAFLRVLDGSLVESQRLARALGDSMMRHLQLPALGREGDHTTGSYWRALDRSRGVYARNLAILRRTAGVVLLLEGPCVNQTAEYQRLQATDLVIEGRGYPGRLRQYADAVVEGLTRAEPPLSQR